MKTYWNGTPNLADLMNCLLEGCLSNPSLAPAIKENVRIIYAPKAHDYQVQNRNKEKINKNKHKN